MTEAYNRWYRHYHDQGKELHTVYKQFVNRVDVWEKYPSPGRDIPKAKYDRLQAAIRYNDFVSNEGQYLTKEQEALEKQLKNAPPGTLQRQSLERQISELEDRFQAWSDVITNEKHRSVHEDKVEYQGRTYTMYDKPTWDHSAQGRFQNAVEASTNFATGAVQGLKNVVGSASPVTMQELCKLATGEAVNGAVSHMLSTPGGGPAGAMAGMARDQAIERATEQSINTACEEFFPTNDSILKQHGLSSRDDPNSPDYVPLGDSSFDRLYEAALSDDPDRMTQAINALTESPFGQQVLAEMNEGVLKYEAQEQQQQEWGAQQQQVEQQQNEQVQQYQRFVEQQMVLVRTMEG